MAKEAHKEYKIHLLTHLQFQPLYHQIRREHKYTKEYPYIYSVLYIFLGASIAKFIGIKPLKSK